MADCCDIILEYDDNEEPIIYDVTDYIPQPIIGFEQSDWEETDETSGAYIKNKPNITSVDPATSAPLMDGTATVGTSVKYAREDHIHPTDQSLVSGLSNVSQGLAGITQRVTTAETKLAGIDAGAEVNTIETVKVNGTALTPDANKAVDVPIPQELFVVNVTLTSATGGTSDKTATQIKIAVTGGKLPVVMLTYNDVNLIAPLTFVGVVEGSDFARFTYIDQNSGTNFPYANIDIASSNATLFAKTSLFATVSQITTYSAGNGIDITNGVISVNYPNGDTQSF